MMKNVLTTKTAALKALQTARETKKPRTIKYQLVGLMTDEETDEATLGFAVNDVLFHTDWMPMDFVNGLKILLLGNVWTTVGLREIDELITILKRPGVKMNK